MTGALTADSAVSPHTQPPRALAQRGWIAIVLAAWIAIYAVLLATGWDWIAALDFRDPDEQLRLQQVRDLLGGQNWFDVTQYRVDAAGGGVAMHWSRLVDIPIAGVILLARPLLGTAGAEMAALIAVPALTLLAVLAIVGWMAARTLPRGGVALAMLASAFAVPVILQVQPLRIDHHGWQIALALAAVAALLDRNERRGGWLTGAALGAWMAISFEGLPLSAWIIAVLALVAWVEDAARARLVGAMQGLATISAALFLATRGLADLANHCDAIAPIHLAMFAWGALAITLANAWRPHSRLALLAGLAVAGTGALTLVAFAAPQCTTGTFDMLDPVVRSLWYDNVQEGKTIFLSPWHTIAQHLVPPLLGLAGAVALARSSAGAERRWWATYALILLGALALGMAVSRSASYAGALAALPLAWLFRVWLTGLKRPANPLLRVGELAGVAALIFVALSPVVPAVALEALLETKSTPAKAAAPALACRARAASGVLGALPSGGILAPMDFGPDILLNSNKSVLATGHHRGAAPMRLVIDAFAGTPEEARSIMRRKGLRYVLVCPNVQEVDLYRKRAPNGFAVRLLEGRAPAWLRPVALPQTSGFKMWEVAE